MNIWHLTPDAPRCPEQPSAGQTRELQRLTWEDGTLVGVTLAWMAAPQGMTLFHIYTVAVMILILSLGFNRGLIVGLSRSAGACIAVMLFGAFSSMRHLMWMETFSLAGCGTFAGILGDRQRRAQEQLKESFRQTLELLARALEARDPYTEGHSRRTARYAAAIAREMSLNGTARVEIEQAGLLHDLGKIGTPDVVLRKEGPLSDDERATIRHHPVIGAQILSGVAFLEKAAVFVRHHHECYDGSGYPDGLSGPAVPLGSRILAVADALDAMTTDRPYRKALRLGDAMLELERGASRQFDPAVLEALKRAHLMLDMTEGKS